MVAKKGRSVESSVTKIVCTESMKSTSTTWSTASRSQRMAVAAVFFCLCGTLHVEGCDRNIMALFCSASFCSSLLFDFTVALSSGRGIAWIGNRNNLAFTPSNVKRNVANKGKMLLRVQSVASITDMIQLANNLCARTISRTSDSRRVFRRSEYQSVIFSSNKPLAADSRRFAEGNGNIGRSDAGRQQGFWDNAYSINANCDGNGGPAYNEDRQLPMPAMPTRNFLTLAKSQFELLANSLPKPQQPFMSDKDVHRPGAATSQSKVKSMALYLPLENPSTGQLEFVPAVTYPPPDSQRVFIATDARTGRPPEIPRTLTRLPGFAKAQSLLPRYPFAAGLQEESGEENDEMSCGCGPVEQVTCDDMLGRRGRGGGECSNQEQRAILSVALYQGSYTAGVLLVWPSDLPSELVLLQSDSMNYSGVIGRERNSGFWTDSDLRQVSRAAYGLSMALSMDRPEGPKREVGGMCSFSREDSTYVSGPTLSSHYSYYRGEASRSGNEHCDGKMEGKNGGEGGKGGGGRGRGRDNVPQSPSLSSSAVRTTTYENLINAQQQQTERLRMALADNLHQVRNPLQALRTFGKLLQRKLAQEECFQKSYVASSGEGSAGQVDALGNSRRETGNSVTSTAPPAGALVDLAPLRSLAENIVTQSDRVVDLMEPMDDIVAALEARPLALPAAENFQGGVDVSDDEENGTLSPLCLAPVRKDGEKFLCAAPDTAGKREAGLENAPESTTLLGLPESERAQEEPNSRALMNDVSSKFEGGENDGDLRKSVGEPVWLVPSQDTASPLSVPGTSAIQTAAAPPTGQEAWPRPASSLVPLSRLSSTSSQQSSSLSSPSAHLGDLEIEMTFLPDVVDPILSASAAVASDRGVEFEISIDDDLPGLKICPKYLQEALANVVDNAIKYSMLSEGNMGINPNPVVRVSLFPNESPPYKPGVTIVVEDNGPGIPVREREAVFGRGYRGSRTKEAVAGDGIGLDISRALVIRMGGTLDVVDKEGECARSGKSDRFLDGAAVRFMFFRDHIH